MVRDNSKNVIFWILFVIVHLLLHSAAVKHTWRCKEANRTNSFRVHLPRKLQFNSQWCVGLTVLAYPHSWPSLWAPPNHSLYAFVREQVRIPVPPASVTNPADLLDSLHRALGEGSEQLANEIRTLQMEYHRTVSQAEQTATPESLRLLNLEEEAKHAAAAASSVAKLTTDANTTDSCASVGPSTAFGTTTGPSSSTSTKGDKEIEANARDIAMMRRNSASTSRWTSAAFSLWSCPKCWPTF